MAQDGDAYGNTVTFNKCCLSHVWYQRRSCSQIGNTHTSAFASVKTWHVIHVDIKMDKHHRHGSHKDGTFHQKYVEGNHSQSNKIINSATELVNFTVCMLIYYWLFTKWNEMIN